MARLWSCGFELNSSTTGVETNGSFTAGATVSNAVVRSGAYAVKFANAASNSRTFQTFGSAASGIHYARVYLWIDTAITGTANDIYILDFESAGVTMAGITLNSSNVVKLYNRKAATQIGTGSVTLNTKQWYCIELKLDHATIATSIVEGRVNGVVFQTSSAINFTTPGHPTQCFAGPMGDTVCTCTLYMDDWAINDGTGSFQNSYPDVGAIIHLQPNAAGDSTQWTPLASTNFSQVSEVTPDDATSYVSSATNGQSDLYNISDPSSVGLHPTSTINLVAVGGRFANDVADATTAFKLQLEKSSSGTLSQSVAIIPNSITYATNAAASPNKYPIILYQDPDSINWTKDTLFRTQIGAVMTAVGVNAIRLSTIWALVEYVPTAGLEEYGRYVSVGNGMSRSEVAN